MRKTLKTLIFLLTDVLLFAASFVTCLALFNIDIGEGIAENWHFFLISAFCTCFFGWLFGLYSTIWRYAGFSEALKIALTAGMAFICNVIISIISDPLNIAWAFLITVFYFGSLCISRFVLKFIGYYYGHNAAREISSASVRVMIIGAGSAGAMLIREMKTSDKINMFPVCIIDDDVKKRGQSVNGVKIVGGTEQIELFAKKYAADEIILAIPSAPNAQKSRILNECQKTSCKVRIVPGIYQFAKGTVSVSSIKDVSIEDLLGRNQVKINVEEVIGYIKDKVVLVTGGGGSIGSELCRQIASHYPKQLIILDIYENNAYDIEQELKRKLPDLNLKTLIASVRDKVKIEKVFKEYKPQIVFHAAAHKHVPLMEESPAEAVKNNIGGTYNVAEAAGRFGAEKFILISTDKAVNPTNVMGATKRVCEMIIQSMNKNYATDYVAVRFGNVLGSNGSVIPLFKRQIQEGGPVTVTHKDIVRYFMTIQEAVNLVLQAGAYATGGEIFILDMGEPVKIYDLAVNMIKLSGLEPFKDIDIVVTGLRPGEKLYEEKLMAEEGLKKTQNDLIHIGQPLSFDEEKLFSSIERLVGEAKKEDPDIKEEVKKLVPTYKIDKR